MQPQSRCGATRCIPWHRSFAPWCDTPRWTHVVRPERLDVMREFAWARSRRTNVSVVYWITPNVAHTTIMNRLLPWSFDVIAVAHAKQPETERRGILAAALAAEPFEFTFVRDPLSHVLSGVRQLAFCLRTGDGLVEILNNVTRNQWSHPQCEELHAFPQTSGYSFGPLGINRLHFVGRMERLQHDWNRLLALVGEPQLQRRVPNAHPRRYDVHEASFLTHPMVRAHTKWDVRCFTP